MGPAIPNPQKPPTQLPKITQLPPNCRRSLTFLSTAEDHSPCTQITQFPSGVSNYPFNCFYPTAPTAHPIAQLLIQLPNCSQLPTHMLTVHSAANSTTVQTAITPTLPYSTPALDSHTQLPHSTPTLNSHTQPHSTPTLNSHTHLSTPTLNSHTQLPHSTPTLNSHSTTPLLHSLTNQLFTKTRACHFTNHGA
eukprot:scaffold137428_cov31-Tisochrysis_lutea.AAC.1